MSHTCVNCTCPPYFYYSDGVRCAGCQSLAVPVVPRGTEQLEQLELNLEPTVDLGLLELRRIWNLS